MKALRFAALAALGLTAPLAAQGVAITAANGLGHGALEVAVFRDVTFDNDGPSLAGCHDPVCKFLQ